MMIFSKWLISIFAALLGFLAAWLVRTTQLNKWRNLITEKDRALEALTGQHKDARSNYDKLLSKHNKNLSAGKNREREMATLVNKFKDLEKQFNSQIAPSPIQENKQPSLQDNRYEIRAWESKYATLKKELLASERETQQLLEENENLHTKLDVIESSAKDALAQKEAALAKLQQYEAYRPRFEQANLERNTLKFKYEQLLAAKQSFEIDNEQVLSKQEALEKEIAKLKTEVQNLNVSTAEKEEQIQNNQSASKTTERQFAELQIKYDSLLKLQERTEDKLKKLQEEGSTL